eukprot:366660_1
MVDASTLISTIYFTANIVLLLFLAYYVKRKGEYESIKSKAFIKDIWSQRRIYAPLIVHFYDTATDIGVVYYWYTLMTDEIDYESVNMHVFFWCGVSFLLLYRLLTLFFVILDVLCNINLDSDWYDIILVLCDLYIFKAVYNSFQQANDKLQKNTKLRKEKIARKIMLQVKTNTQTQKNSVDKHEDLIEIISDTEKKEETNENKLEEIKPGKIINDTEKKEETNENKLEEIEPGKIQFLLLLGESITESMPQIMLQSVFIIRAQNDSQIANGDILLISLSIIASIFSISNKFVFLDKDQFHEKARSLNPKEEFPHCVNYWYILRVLWRMTDIMSKFTIYVLMWTVLGGLWLVIWCAALFFMWTIFFCSVCSVDNNLLLPFLWSIIAAGGIHSEVTHGGQHLLRYFENCIGLAIIYSFASLDFECGICASSDMRQFTNTSSNNRILMFFSLGCVSAFIQAILCLILRCYDIANVD